MLSPDALKRIEDLMSSSTEFILAVVVRTEGPTSAKPGSWAVVHRDGTIEGWIGGSCVRPSVSDRAKQLFDGGTPVLLRFSPSADPTLSIQGIEEIPMTCSSEGTMEIYLEPYLKNSHILIIGNSPVVNSLASLAKLMKIEVSVVTPDGKDSGVPDVEVSSAKLDGLNINVNTYVVVATHQNFPMISDTEILEKLVDSGARYIGFVSSRKRAETVLDQMLQDGIPREKIFRVRSPAGISLGDKLTPEEISLSIISEIVGIMKGGDFSPIEPARLGASATQFPKEVGKKERDLVCGMKVNIEAAKYTTEYQGKKYYFCSPICKKEFEEDQEKFVNAA